MDDRFNDKEQNKIGPSGEEGSRESFLQPENSQELDENQQPPEREAEQLHDFQDLHDPKKPVKVNRSKKKHGCLSTLIWALILLVVSGVASVFIITAALDMTGIAKEDKEVLVTVPKGSSTMDIADILKDSGVIQNPYAFRVYSKLKEADGTYQYGTFTVNVNMSYGQLIDTMQQVATYGESVEVVFPEGFTVREMAERLEEKGVCKAQNFIDALNGASFGYKFETSLPVNENRYYKYEGYLFPAKYDFYEDEDPLSVAKKMVEKFNQVFSNEYAGRAGELSMSVDKVLIIASIIQAEAGDIENMKLVSSVLYNRLNDSAGFPKLQSDPTRLYAKEALAGIMDEERALSLYDTYVCDGLPAGPVCNPGEDAIVAALYPEDSDYYYFCSDLQTGEFYYATTLEEHEANLKKAGLS